MEASIFSQGLARYFSADQMEKLADARVGIAGAGGLGSNCAMMLARSGVGHFVLVDDDVVDASNLNRQHFFPQHLGVAKVDALAEQMLALSDTIDVQVLQQRLTVQNVQDAFASCSIVVEAVDLASTKSLIIQELLEADKTVVAASGMAGWDGDAMHKKTFGSRLIVVGDFLNEVATAQETVSTPQIYALPPLAPRVIMAASMQADAVLGCILGPCEGMLSVK